MQCHSCDHTLIEKARFCDDCGDSTARVDLDEESLKTYCSKCAATLRGARKYCIHCGEPSPHSGKFSKKKDESWIVNVLTDHRLQMAIVGLLLIIAALPTFTDIRYRFSAAAPFVGVYMEEPPLAAIRRSHDNFRIEPLMADGDGGEPIGSAAGVVRDSREVLYVADSQRHVVYKIAADGVRTRYAGTGEAGYDGDGGPATQAKLNQPRGLTVDDLDGLLIADSGNNVIRRVNERGIITTVAGQESEGEKPNLTLAKLTDARTAHLLAPSTVSADVDGTLYVTEDPCLEGARPPTVWVLRPN